MHLSKTILALSLGVAQAFAQTAAQPLKPLTQAPATSGKAAPAVASSTSPATSAQPAPIADTAIHVRGSDLLQTAIGEPLTRYAQQAHLAMDVDMRGSIAALSGLKSGTVQLAIVDAPPGTLPAPKEYTAIPLCFAADYVIVNAENPLNALDMGQIAAVFGSTKRSATIWGDLRAPADWAARPIFACTTSTDDGVALEMFKNEALGTSELLPTIRIMPTAHDLIKVVADTPAAIGVCAYDPGPPNKVLLLAKLPDSSSISAPVPNAARPTAENLLSGDYPLRLPFYIVFRPEDKTRVLPLIRLLLGDEYAAHLTAEHFIPVPDTIRNRSLLELDNSR